MKLSWALAAVYMAACGGQAPITTVSDGGIRGTVTENTGAAVANAAVALIGNALEGGAQASVSALVLSRAMPDTCVLARPDFGGPATAADRALFAYDASAPLNLTKAVDSTRNGVVFSTISFSSPDGGAVPGIMTEPVGRSGLRPGIVVVRHTAKQAWSEAVPLTQRGAVAIAIDAPYVRRGAPNAHTFTVQDRNDQIQLTKDLQRAIDVLLVQGNVDPARIAFGGYSFGGMIGVRFAGIETRLKAAVITAGHGGQVSLATNKNRLQTLSAVSCATRNAWFRSMVPIESIRYIPGASPTALLFQIARFDSGIPLEDAQLAYNAASTST